MFIKEAKWHVDTCKYDRTGRTLRCHFKGQISVLNLSDLQTIITKLSRCDSPTGVMDSGTIGRNSFCLVTGLSRLEYAADSHSPEEKAERGGGDTGRRLEIAEIRNINFTFNYSQSSVSQEDWRWFFNKISKLTPKLSIGFEFCCARSDQQLIEVLPTAIRQVLKNHQSPH